MTCCTPLILQLPVILVMPLTPKSEITLNFAAVPEKVSSEPALSIETLPLKKESPVWLKAPV